MSTLLRAQPPLRQRREERKQNRQRNLQEDGQHDPAKLPSMPAVEQRLSDGITTRKKQVVTTVPTMTIMPTRTSSSCAYAGIATTHRHASQAMRRHASIRRG
jgi:hypothetical protein